MRRGVIFISFGSWFFSYRWLSARSFAPGAVARRMDYAAKITPAIEETVRKETR
jgi:hypothetical protein